MRRRLALAMCASGLLLAGLVLASGGRVVVHEGRASVDRTSASIEHALTRVAPGGAERGRLVVPAVLGAAIVLAAVGWVRSIEPRPVPAPVRVDGRRGPSPRAPPARSQPR